MIAILLYMSACSRSPEPVAGLIDFGVQGGWCWYEEDRVLIDGDQVLIGTVASGSGDIHVTTWNLAGSSGQTFTLHERLQSDDHASPALLRLGDGRYLASYATHVDIDLPPGHDLMRWRRTTAPGDTTAWEPERTLSVGAPVSYTNLIRLPGEGGRIYNFHRGVGFDPNWLVSDDDGLTFRYGGRLMAWEGRPDRLGSGRPYVRYASDGDATIHIVSTEDHPRNFDNSIWHGIIRGGRLYDSAGANLGPLPTSEITPFSPTDLTRVFEGGPERVAWTSDLRLDASGAPVIAFSVQHGDANVRERRTAGGQDLRYWYARWVDGAWQVRALAHAGTRLYSPEVDYAGLVALHPTDPDQLWISTNADPTSGRPLRSHTDGQRHWEIFRGQTDDGGESWSWTPVTRNSTVDHIRPVARSAGERGVLVVWLSGTYTSYERYQLSVVGLLQTP